MHKLNSIWLFAGLKTTLHTLAENQKLLYIHCKDDGDRCEYYTIVRPYRGGSKNRNPQNPPKFTKSSVLNRSIVTETCLNQQRQPPTLSGQRTWAVDEIEIASSLNFSILVARSLLNACECVDFVSSTGFRGSH